MATRPNFRTIRLPVPGRERERVYEQSNGRDFYDPSNAGGIYAGAGGAPRLLEDGSLRLIEDATLRLCE